MRSLFNGDLPKLIMFDLDGTLVDSVPDLASAVDAVLRGLELPEVGEANVRLWVGNGAELLIKRALTHVLHDVGTELLDKAFAEFLSTYANCFSVASKLYPGVSKALELFDSLGIEMAVVTNKPIAFALPLLSELKIDHFFSEVLGGDSLERKKPDPLPLNILMKYYGLRPFEVLMVGDSVTDILAAKAANCPVVAVSYGYNHGGNIYEAGADRVVSSIEELLS